MHEMWVPSPGPEDPLEWEIATCASILAWKIQWTEEPGRLQPFGSQRVRHDWVRVHTHTHTESDMTECARVRTHTHTHTHTPNSWPPFTHFAHPPESPFPTGNHYSVLSVSLFLFYFVCWILLCLRFHIWVQSYSVCLWLTSLSVMPSGSILVTDGKISFFMAGNIEIYLFESVFPCSLEKIPRSRVAGSCSVLFLIFWGNPYYFL